ncbi:MAG: hypothetical protein HYZ53_25705 [Planctomycetes bacterium]|nr:hypothetical protein [Planctomycetota bacterium]
MNGHYVRGFTVPSYRYIEERTLAHDLLRGWWTDAGTFESLHHASNLVAQGGANRKEV